MASIPTVKVASEDTPEGYIIINESDFNPKIHKRWSENASSKSKSATPSPKVEESSP